MIGVVKEGQVWQCRAQSHTATFATKLQIERDHVRWRVAFTPAIGGQQYYEIKEYLTSTGDPWSSVVSNYKPTLLLYCPSWNASATLPAR
jgi:hypothetical protein